MVTNIEAAEAVKAIMGNKATREQVALFSFEQLSDAAKEEFRLYGYPLMGLSVWTRMVRRIAGCYELPLSAKEELHITTAVMLSDLVVREEESFTFCEDTCRHLEKLADWESVETLNVASSLYPAMRKFLKDQGIGSSWGAMPKMLRHKMLRCVMDREWCMSTSDVDDLFCKIESHERGES